MSYWQADRQVVTYLQPKAAQRVHVTFRRWVHGLITVHELRREVSGSASILARRGHVAMSFFEHYTG